MLTPINLHKPTEYREFQLQRLSCGWNHSDDILSTWRSQCDDGTKTLFWITCPPTTNTTSKTSPPTTATPVRIGHISLDRVSPPTKPPLLPNEMTIATFFILPAYRSLGLGNAAMSTLEKWATEEPYGSKECTAIVVDTLSRWYSETEEGREVMRACGGGEPVPKGRSNEDWYARRGYVKFLERETYVQRLLEGGEVKLVAVYLRKVL